MVFVFFLFLFFFFSFLVKNQKISFYDTVVIFIKMENGDNFLNYFFIGFLTQTEPKLQIFGTSWGVRIPGCTGVYRSCIGRHFEMELG